MNTVIRQTAKTACVALAFSFSSASVFTVTATSAFAEKGGNGNGRGNSRAEREDRTNNGRGQIARELGHLNAAHANANALANASPNSVPGQLNLYRQAQETVSANQPALDLLFAEYSRLSNLDENEIATEFPEGGYEIALAKAMEDYLSAGDDMLAAQTVLEESLAVLTGGQELSQGAMDELMRLLEL